jgi:hypothetical protein
MEAFFPFLLELTLEEEQEEGEAAISKTCFSKEILRIAHRGSRRLLQFTPQQNVRCELYSALNSHRQSPTCHEEVAKIHQRSHQSSPSKLL